MTLNRSALPFLVIILDGLATNPNERGNAVFHAKKPFLDKLFSSCPKTELVTWGPRVGLPDGQMGNSEVGHLNIGGGRIVQQELTRINLAVQEKKIGSLPEFEKACTQVISNTEKSSRALHFIGLVSNGGVHSSREHLEALILAALEKGVKHIFIHAITDGRDRPPTASLLEVGQLQTFLSETCAQTSPSAEVKIASLIGRYYAMDRDNRWERTEKAYRLFTEGLGKPFQNPLQFLESEHKAGRTDEFLESGALDHTLTSRSPLIQDGDALVFFNFRADRMRQIVPSFLPPEKFSFLGFQRNKLAKLSSLCTLTEYSQDLPVEVLFKPTNVVNHFGQIISQAGLRQLRIAETEKYAHVTYFFNGGVEAPSLNEERILVPSPRDVATYDLKPEMSAFQVTEKLIENLKQGKTDVAIINFANCDMVGHTGNFDAAVKAVEAVDTCLGKILEFLEKSSGSAIVTADHGNSDQMVDYLTGAPHTFHTMYPVPLFIVGKSFQGVKLSAGGALCDIAPTACEMLGIVPPPEMTGRSLIMK